MGESDQFNRLRQILVNLSRASHSESRGRSLANTTQRVASQHRMNWSQRKFGIELEAIIPRTPIVSDISGLFTHLNRRQPQAFQQWKVKRDSSIHCRQYDTFAAEIVSPILNWNALHAIHLICSELQQLNCLTNTSTGLHVHCDASNLTQQEIAAIVINYSHFEHVIDRFVDNSRRLNRNRYCRSIRGVVRRNEIWRGFSTDANPVVVNPQGKYHKLNCNTLRNHLRLPTIENRHHHGTVNPDAVANWTKLYLMIIHQSNLNGVIDVRGTQRDSDARKQLFWQFIDNQDLKDYYTQREHQFNQ